MYDELRTGNIEKDDVGTIAVLRVLAVDWLLVCSDLLTMLVAFPVTIW